MKLILVCGPFGSGTSAVAGLIARLGLPGVEPYVSTDDPRTSNTFESQEFRETLLRIISEEKLALNNDVVPEIEINRFHDRIMTLGHSTIFLKHALSAFVLLEVCKVFDTRLVYVLRPLPEIEATRERRGWSPQYGAAGAKIIYDRMFEAWINHQLSPILLHYSTVIKNPLKAAKLLAQFASLPADSHTIQFAADFIESHLAHWGRASGNP